MKEERMQILKMVESGKISVDEAAKLLEVINAGSYDPFETYEPSGFDEKCRQFSKNAESFAKDFSAKMGQTFKDVEPKLKKVTKVVVEKTAGVISELSRALNESLKNMEKAEECCCDEKEPCCCDEAPAENCCNENSAENCCCDDVPKEN